MEILTKDVCVRIGGKEIVKEASIRVKRGELVGLFGPNGSGKSTLLKSIYRVLKPSAGEIFLDGIEMKKISHRDSARNMAVVTQFTTLNFEFTVEEMVLMGRSPHKKAFDRDTLEDFQIVRDCLKKVDMESFAKRKFSTLSGGEKQRILLARALAQQTETLILDEPTNHLDIKYQLQTMDIIKQLGKGVLMALHDLNLAFRYCDYVFLLKDGKVVADGKPEEVITEEMVRKVYEVENRIFTNPVTGQAMIAFLSPLPDSVPASLNRSLEAEETSFISSPDISCNQLQNL